MRYPGNPGGSGLPPIDIYTPSVSRAAAAEHWNIDFKVLDAAGYLSTTPYEGDPRVDFLRLKGLDEEEYIIWPCDKTGIHPDEADRFALLRVDGCIYCRQARRSLAEIMELPYSSFDRATESQTIPAVLSFDSFVAAHPEWGNDVPGAYVFFRDHPKMKQNPLIQRMTEGCGTLVACAVLQHYLAALANDGVAPTLDIACWFRKHAPSDVLEKHIFHPFEEGKWGWPKTVDVMDVLPLILNEEENSIAVDQAPSFEEMPNLLQRYGPILLDRWGARIESNSGEEEEKEEAFVGGCTLLVVGYRTFDSPDSADSGEEQETRLLLQRWWPADEPQFMEVRFEDFETDLVEKEGQAIYVTAPQKCIPPKFDVTTATFNRCSIHMVED